MSNPELLASYRKAVEDNDAKTQRQIENRLIKDNINLVRKLVAKLVKRMTTACPADKEDLHQAGMIGMLIAWKKWIPEKGRFSTYAMHWIRHEVQDCLGDYQPIYKPRQSGKPWAVYRKQEAIRAKEGREATAEELGVRPAKLEEWRMSPAVTSIDEVPHGILQGLSGSAHYKEQGAPLDGMHEIIADGRPNPERAYSNAELAKLMVEGMKDLTEREAFIIEQLFIEEETYPTVANALGVSTEQVRQGRLSALGKIKEKVEK